MTCHGHSRWQLDRRTLLRMAGVGAAGWLTSIAQAFGAEEERSRGRQPAQSVILLWLAGGPSQLETFDPHPNSKISGETRAIRTAVPGIQLAAGFEQLADQMQHVSLVRSLVSKEGDHERGTYFLKTGYRMDATVVHPSIGAICCHELSAGKTEIPRHVSILPGQWPGRGGFLGDQYDAFRMGDPAQRVPDVTSRVSEQRLQQRLNDLDAVESAFARGRAAQVDRTLHRESVTRARTMMTSEQLAAFDVTKEPLELRQRYGDTPFGRGCLAARRLIEVGVRCVEVTLTGWDAHVNNHQIHADQLKILDPAFATLLSDLAERKLLDRTVVMCGGEFGRTPTINRLGGRDHWPHAFSMALAGGGIRAGQVLGETDPDGSREVKDPAGVPNIHATVLTALGLDPTKENISPIGRPLKLADGKPLEKLLS